MVLSKTPKPSLQTSLENFMDLSESVFKITPKVQKAILELDPKNAREVSSLRELIKFNCLVITHFSELKESFPDESEKVAEAFEELVRLLPEDGTLILNWEDSQVRRFADKFNGRGIVFFGFDEKNCHVWASNIRVENFQTVFELNYGVERVEVRSNLLGHHQIIPVLAAAAAAINLGLSLISVKKGIETVEALDGRMQVVTGLNNSIIIDDTYDGEIKGFSEGLKTINLIPARRRIVVLGEMSADIKTSEKVHTQIAREIYSNKIDLVLLGAGQARYVEEELGKLGFIPERMMSGLQNPGMVSNLLKILGKGDVVLIKGHPNLRFSEIVKKITKTRR
jgi:UDP-N-acetylmuramoyl-tripeptide--D-alanyl-D-alanine ligase